eukprot:scaffold475085_cov51-Attheya_sp.AAC.1
MIDLLFLPVDSNWVQHCDRSMHGRVWRLGVWPSDLDGIGAQRKAGISRAPACSYEFSTKDTVVQIIHKDRRAYVRRRKIKPPRKLCNLDQWIAPAGIASWPASAVAFSLSLSFNQLRLYCCSHLITTDRQFDPNTMKVQTAFLLLLPTMGAAFAPAS